MTAQTIQLPRTAIDWDAVHVHDVSDVCLPYSCDAMSAKRIDALGYGTETRDRIGQAFTVLGPGSVQGSVILRDQHRRHFQADCGTMLIPVTPRKIPSPRALSMLRRECLIASATQPATQPDYARIELSHPPSGEEVTLEAGDGHAWPSMHPEALEAIALTILWRILRGRMALAQATRVTELEHTLRTTHGELAVRVTGSRLAVLGTRIAAAVETNGNAVLTWADGSHTTSPATIPN